MPTARSPREGDRAPAHRHQRQRADALVAKALEGAKTGDYRVYARLAKQFYAVHVIEYIPSSVQPYAEVRGTMTKKVYGESVQKAGEEYIAKLRKSHDVKVVPGPDWQLTAEHGSE